MASWRLAYSVVLEFCDQFGNPLGQSFPFSGSILSEVQSPAAADLATMATNLGAALSTQIQPLGGTLNLPNPSD
jgi:hypothetical protein